MLFPVTVSEEIPESLATALRAAGGAVGLGPHFERYVAAYFEELGLLVCRIGLPGQVEFLSHLPSETCWWVPQEMRALLDGPL